MTMAERQVFYQQPDDERAVSTIFPHTGQFPFLRSGNVLFDNALMNNSHFATNRACL